MICPRCGYDNLPGNDDCTRCLLDLAQLDLPAGHDRVQSSLIDDCVSTLDPRAAVVISEQATLRDAIQSMEEHGVGALMVVGESGGLTGIFTERDLLMRAADLHPDGFAKSAVRDYMTARPITVVPDDSLARALQKMDVGSYRHLPVVSGGKPVGMISVRDVVRHITSLCKE